jgi:hypothetical protein
MAPFRFFSYYTESPGFNAPLVSMLQLGFNQFLSQVKEIKDKGP